MNVKKQIFGLFAVAVLLTTSCSKSAVDEPNMSLSFNGQINTLLATTAPTAASTSWTLGDQIGIFMVDQGTTNVTENNSNKAYRYDGTQFSAITGQEIYYPVSDAKVDFISYYPYSSTASLTNDFTVDVSNQSDLSQVDILYAQATNGTTGFSKLTGTKVPLVFDHVLSKIVIKPVAGEGLEANSSLWENKTVTIKGMQSTASLDLSTGRLADYADPTDIVPFTNTSSYEAIVLPARFSTARAVQFTFEIGGDTYVWYSQANEQFEAGKVYTYTITVNKTGLALDHVSIKDWDVVTRSGVAD